MSVTETMTNNIADDLLSRYLLGELSDDEQRRVEERLMTDDEYFRALLAAEDELMDAYVLSGLTPRQLARFENHFLCTPERREGVRFAAAFTRYLASDTAIDSPAPIPPGRETDSWFKSLSQWLTAQTRVPRFATSGLALIALLGLSVLIFKVVQLQTEVEQLRSAGAQTRVQELEELLAVERDRVDHLSEELQREQVASGEPNQRPTSPATDVKQGEQQASSTPPRTISIVLSAMRVREAGQTQRVSLPRGTQTVELLVTLPGDDYSNCRAVLSSEGKEMKRWESVRVRKAGSDSSISLSLPAGLLSKGGDFVVRLSPPGTTDELESLGAYFFRVAR